MKFVAAMAGLFMGAQASEPGAPAECTRYERCNGDMCMMVCEVGSVVLDEWATEALAFQRNLAQNRSFVFWSSQPSTHNGGQAADLGFGIEEKAISDILGEPIVIAEQRHAPVDQLRMGARNIELDVYYAPLTEGPGLKICHWPVGPQDYCRYVDRQAAAQGLSYNWDCSQMGCSDAWSPEWETALGDIVDWMRLPENSGEFVTLYIDNKAVTRGQLPEFQEITERLAGDMIFRPEHVANPNDLSTWPSVAELVSQGRRLILENNRNDWAGTEADHTFWTGPIWSGSRSGSQFGLSSFNSYPSCTVGSTDYYGRGQSRWFDGSINLGSDTNGHPLWGGNSNRFVADSSLQALTDCGINVFSKDQLIPDNMQHFVWSWAKGELLQAGDCAQLGSDGRWHSGSCGSSYRHACSTVSMTSGEGTWVLSEAGGAFGEAQCPQGTSFDAPLDGLQNSRLADLANGELLWINYRA